MKPSEEFLNHLICVYPDLKNESLANGQELKSLVSEYLISPFTIQIPRKAVEQAISVARSFFQLRENKKYQNMISPRYSDPGNKSIMMSYDYHLTSDGNLKLIEINTNAAFLILGYELYQSKHISNPVPGFSKQKISDSILNELGLHGGEITSPSVIITDSAPEQQRLYIEFLVYKNLFKSLGWDASICDTKELSIKHKANFIYNRNTDFYFENPDSQGLKNLFTSKQACISPNPFDYELLADKERMIQWASPGFFESIHLNNADIENINSVLPKCQDMTAESAEMLWSQKKSLFFKPKREFGSKLAFKGASISRKVFDELIQKNGIAQEYIPAPEQEFMTPDGIQKYKFDLRCFAYMGELQLIIARVYQGQVTNLRTANGGFACVVTND